MYSGGYARASPAENGYSDDRDSNQRVKTALMKLEEKIMQSESEDGNSPRDVNRMPSRTSLPVSNSQRVDRTRRSAPGGGATRQSDSEEGYHPSKGDVGMLRRHVESHQSSRKRAEMYTLWQICGSRSSKRPRHPKCAGVFSTTKTRPIDSRESHMCRSPIFTPPL